LTNWVVR